MKETARDAVDARGGRKGSFKTQHMQGNVKENMEGSRIRYLDAGEKLATRALYEAAFPEDSREFTDYYYKWKIKDNEIIVMEGAGRDSSFHVMIHLNPYQVSIYGETMEVPYLVAVATAKEQRRQGKMGAVMRHALRDMERRRLPFTFLLPADPAYYRGQGFVFFPCQQPFAVQGEGITGNIDCETATTWDTAQMAAFANRILGQRYGIYIRRDAYYYRRALAELEAEHGNALLLKNHGELCGILLYGLDGAESGGTAEVKELLLEKMISEEDARYLCKRILESQGIMAEPKCTISRMMVRIVALTELVPALRSSKPVSLAVEVEDAIIEANNGCFQIDIDETGGRLKRIPAALAERQADIAELSEELFRNTAVYLNEWV